MALKELEKQIYRCARAGWCKSPVFKDRGINKICPLYEYPAHLWECFSIRGILSIAQALLDGGLNVDEKMAEVVYKCNLCGGCHETCVIHLPVLMKVSNQDELNHIRIVEELRSICVEKGFLKIPAHKKSLESLARYGNPFEIADRRERLSWIKGLEFNVKILPEQKANVLLYTGSMYALEPTVQDTLKAVARVLHMAEVDFGVLKEETDEGLYAIQLGEKGLFEDLAERNLETFNSLDAKILVTPDPHAYNAFKRYYPKIGSLDMEVFHITEFVNNLIEDGKIVVREIPKMIATYHDPCNLGRICGVYDAPRRIITAIKGLEFREMNRNRNYSWCCGAGGGIMAAYPEFMNWTAGKRMEEVRLTGASTLITACPWCEYAFKTSCSDQTIRVQNIIELLDESVKRG
ncbi:MAG: (Fe-S)-binding protein [Candidatus Bathyarchaeia archaeon]